MGEAAADERVGACVFRGTVEEGGLEQEFWNVLQNARMDATEMVAAGRGTVLGMAAASGSK